MYNFCLSAIYKLTSKSWPDLKKKIKYLSFQESAERSQSRHESAERSLSRLKQIKSYTRSTIDEIRLSDLSLLNIEKEFSENLDFNSVVDTFVKMKNRRKQLVW